MQLHRRLLKKEARCSESRKKLLSVCGELNSVCQIHNLSKKRAGDLSEELGTTAACHRQEVRLCEERAQESWVAALRTERVLSELTRERPPQAAAGPGRVQLPALPEGPSCSCCSTHSPQGPAGVRGAPGSRGTPPARRGGGSSPEDAGARGHLQARLSSLQPVRHSRPGHNISLCFSVSSRTQHQPVFFLFQVGHNISLCFPCFKLSLFFSLILATVT